MFQSNQNQNIKIKRKKKMICQLDICTNLFYYIIQTFHQKENFKILKSKNEYNLLLIIDFFYLFFFLRV